MCLFVKTLPIETTLRVWDCFFAEGQYFLLRVGLALFKYYETDLLALADTGELLKFLQKMGCSLLDCEALIQITFTKELQVKPGVVEKYRKKFSGK